MDPEERWPQGRKLSGTAGTNVYSSSSHVLLRRAFYVVMAGESVVVSEYREGCLHIDRYSETDLKARSAGVQMTAAKQAAYLNTETSQEIHSGSPQHTITGMSRKAASDV